MPEEIDDDLDIIRDAEYVYRNLYASHPTRPPSSGARGMLEWAKSDPSKFFTTTLEKILKARQKEDTEITHSKVPLKQVQQMLDELDDKWSLKCAHCGHRLDNDHGSV